MVVRPRDLSTRRAFTLWRRSTPTNPGMVSEVWRRDVLASLGMASQAGRGYLDNPRHGESGVEEGCLGA